MVFQQVTQGVNCSLKFKILGPEEQETNFFWWSCSDHRDIASGAQDFYLISPPPVGSLDFGAARVFSVFVCCYLGYSIYIMITLPLAAAN